MACLDLFQVVFFSYRSNYLLKLGFVFSHVWCLISQMIRVNTLVNALPLMCFMFVLAAYGNAVLPHFLYHTTV